MRRFLLAPLLCTLAMPVMAETVVLKNGDIINGPITAQDGASVSIDHPSLGNITIPREKIETLYKDEDAYDAAQTEAAAKDKAAALEAERAADEGLFGVGFLQGWNRRIEFGLTGAEGVSENLNMRAGFFADYEDEDDRWILDMVYRRAKSGSAITENNFYTMLTKDWLLPEHDYFYFANGRYDWDDLQDWEHRLSGFGGVGYQFVKDGKWDVRGRGGLGGNQEFGSQDDGFTPEALLGIEIDYKITDDHSIAFSNTLFPSLDDAGEFRNITTLDYVISINKDKGIDLRFGVANEHDSNVAPGAKKNDFEYYAALVWSF